MGSFFIITDENGINYYEFDEFAISNSDSYLLNNKMYGEFITTHQMQEENFELSDTCSVCMSTKDELPRQLYLKTPCNHIFCADCVAGVLLNNSISCPLCRADISMFSEFHYNGDLTDPIPETYQENDWDSGEDSDIAEYISQQEFDDTLYQLLVEYWTSVVLTI